MLRPHLLNARVRRRTCEDPTEGREGQPPVRDPLWTLHVTYRRPEFDAPEATAVLSLTDELSAFQIDLYLRAAQRGDRAAARLLFAALH